jgi:tetratricopeptide (TPR) repeat protein
MVNKTICLNMIVKNESAIITRLFDSIISIIDTYCICDTGSTDNTVSIIETYFNERGIKGKVIREPFKNFEYNRTFSLQQCYGLSDYILLMDADMTLTINNFNKNDMDADIYSIIQGSEDFYYYNIRIVRNVPNICYRGVTHEYLEFPNITKKVDIKKENLFINDIGDGGAKSDKYERDIRLLLDGIEKEPNNIRYYFYLANSYFCIRDLNNAINYYLQRIKLGGWIQEIWYSYFRVGICYKLLNQYEKAIYYWLEGYNAYPDRIENLYEIVNYYRINSKNNLALQFYNIAESIINNKNINIDEHLFLDYSIYNYKLYEEYLIFSFYCNNANINIYQRLYIQLLNNNSVPSIIFNNILSNHKFYNKALEPKLVKINLNIDNTHLLKISSALYTNDTISVDDAKGTFGGGVDAVGAVGGGVGGGVDVVDGGGKEYVLTNSTPSICFIDNNLYVNVRYISYQIDDNGNYINKDKIITVNKIMIFNVNNNNICNVNHTGFIVNYNKQYDDYYIGLEDIRLFNYKNELCFNANRMVNGSMCIEHGTIDLIDEKVISTFLEYSGATGNTEKNWITFIKDDKKYQIYKWHPLTICTIDPKTTLSDTTSNTKGAFCTKIEHKVDIKTPKLFSIIRGSTNGIKVDNEIWFICHLVSYENKRHYYHVVVVLDEESLNLKRYSDIFTIKHNSVEYILGFCYDSINRNFYISYSIMDRTSEIAMISYDNLVSYFPSNL